MVCCCKCLERIEDADALHVYMGQQPGSSTSYIGYSLHRNCIPKILGPDHTYNAALNALITFNQLVGGLG
jgi:hypothetical protein